MTIALVDGTGEPAHPPHVRDCLGVLLVEDDTLVRMGAASACSDAGMTVFEASDADEAIALLVQRDDIHVVVTDLDMAAGRIPGHDLVRLLVLRWPVIDVLVISGGILPKPGELPEGVRFIPKPCRDQELVGAVFALVSHRHGGI